MDECLAELKAAAFEVLLLTPGIEMADWVKTMVEQYPCEVADAYGQNPPEVYAALNDLWETPYEDINSGLVYDYKTWAAAFATDEAVRMYYDLTSKMKNVSAM